MFLVKTSDKINLKPK